MIQKLQEIGYTDACLEYLSWEDGVCGDGVIVEQQISKAIFSKYIQKDKVYYQNNQGENFLGDYNHILASHKDGLLLDMIYNKIYLNGRKLSSQDIPSQTSTIHILSCLLGHIGQDLSNKKLEISSYSKNKNEMTGKIILPLIALIEKETGEKIPLICKGSMYDFYLKLNPTNIKIAYLRKI